MEPSSNRLCGRRCSPIHSIPYSVAYRWRAVYKYYSFIIRGGFVQIVDALLFKIVVDLGLVVADIAHIRCVTKDTADFCTGSTDVSVPILATQPGKFIDDCLFPVALRIERENHPYGSSLFFVDNVCTVDLNHPPGHEW